MYTIYRFPRDYPGRYVVRGCEVRGAGIFHDLYPLAVALTLEDARSALPPGLYNLGREPADEPQIVEVWV